MINIEKEMKIKAVGLLRISSKKQELAGDSTQKQKEEISSTLKRYHVDEITWIELTVSGSKTQNAAAEVISYCKNNLGTKYCFIHRIDRWTRLGSTTYHNLKKDLARYGTSLIDVEGIISLETRNTMEFVNREYAWSVYSPSLADEFRAADYASVEIRNSLTRMIGSERRYSDMGYFIGHEPDGYIRVRQETDNGKRIFLEPNPKRAKYFKAMFELRIQGKVDEQICEAVNLMGYKSPRTVARNSEGKIIGYKGEHNLHPKQLNKFLRNTMYALISNQKWVDKPTKMHGTPIISIKAFNAANRGKLMITEDLKVLKEKPLEKYLRNARSDETYPYKPYVFCPSCKGKLRASASTGKSGKKFPAYHCSKGHKSFRVPVSKFEDTLFDFVKKVEFTPEFKEKIKNITIDELAARLKITATESINKGQLVQDLKIEKQNLVDTLKRLKLQSAIESIEAEIDEIDTKLNKLMETRNEIEVEEISIQELLNHVNFYIEHFEELVFSRNNPVRDAAFFGLIFNSTPTYEELKSGTPNLAPLFRLNEAFKHSNSSIVSGQVSISNPTLNSYVERVSQTFQQFQYAI